MHAPPPPAVHTLPWQVPCPEQQGRPAPLHGPPIAEQGTQVQFEGTASHAFWILLNAVQPVLPEPEQTFPDRPQLGILLQQALLPMSAHTSPHAVLSLQLPVFGTAEPHVPAPTTVISDVFAVSLALPSS